MKRKRLPVLLLAIVYVAPNSCVSIAAVDGGSANRLLHRRFGRNILSDEIIKEELPPSAPKFVSPKNLDKWHFRQAGTSVEFRCIAEGNPTPNITWYKNKKTPIKRTFFAPTYGTWSITLEEITKEDEAEYTCVICNQLGCIEHTTQLWILAPYPSIPHIKDGYPVNVVARINETVTFACPYISNPEPNLYWIRTWNDSMEGNNYESIFPINDTIKSQNPEDKPGQLTLYNITKEDEGWYVCVAINNLGKTTAKGYLSVLESTPSSVEPKQAKQEQPTSLLNIIIAVSGGLLIVAAMVVVTTCMKLKRENKQKRLALETARDVIETYWSKKVTIEKPLINNSPHAAEALVLPIIKIEKQKVSEVKNNTNDTRMLSEYELPLDEDWEVPRKTVVLGKVLGEGEFGKVVKADCVGVLKRGQSTVAVKMLKDGHTDAEMMALVAEMEIMKVVGKHVNIINLLGCCTQGGPLFVIVEYAPYGSLKDFLRNHRPGIITESTNESLKDKGNLTPQDLVSFGYQAAKGMEYLASRHCIHRDLAARNVLVSENFILKIADFGLAKNIENDYYYRKKTSGKLPVRWMAPESLCSMLFTIQTDVWSFGVLLWEIMTLGATPYRTVQGQYLFQHLRAGHRLEKPPGCSLNLYLLMRECWSFSPKGRPSFTVLVKELEKILTKMTNVEYLDLSPSESETSQVTNTLWLSRKPSVLHEKEGDEKEGHEKAGHEKEGHEKEGHEKEGQL